MNFLAFPGETTFLELKLANGSGWLTSRRPIFYEPKHCLTLLAFMANF
jgi:hypothetical protein